MTERDLNTILARIGDHNQQLPLGELAKLTDLDQDEMDLLSAEWPTFELSHRRSIAQSMQELSEASPELNFHEAFIIFLADEDPTVRAAAVKGLWEDDRRSTMRRLLSVLASDPDDNVREAAALTLGAWTLRIAEGDLDQRISAELERTLLELYNDQTRPIQIRRRVLETLGYLGDQPVIAQAIEEAHRNPEELWQQSALCAMGHSGLTRWRPQIKKALGNPAPAIRYEAARAVGELGDEGRPLLQTMAPLVTDRDVEVALAAIWALGQVGGQAARRLLEGLIRESEGARQETAEAALAELKFYGDPLVSAPFSFDDDDEDEDE